MKREPLRREFVVKLFDQRFEFGPFELEAQLRDAPLEELLIRQRSPVSHLHFAHRISPSAAVTLSPVGGARASRALVSASRRNYLSFRVSLIQSVVGHQRFRKVREGET